MMNTPMRIRKLSSGSAAIVVEALVLFWTLTAATFPPGFVATPVVNGNLNNPTAMEIAPDGRLFVCEQSGALRVVKNDNLLTRPFLKVTVNFAGERGLLGIAFDPAFDLNHYLYVYYTATTPALHNRISRFTASGDTALAGSETVILDINNLSSATNHNGGAIHFGLDGKLYVGVGENANSSNAQTLGNLLGKMLRINSDGSIPSDNPFFDTASGDNKAIWALGLRNPFTFAFQQGTGRMFINDVGLDTWEEIDDGIAGSNYGWPVTEGFTNTPGFLSPLFAYGHGSGDTLGEAITGGAFYNPVTTSFPSSYVGDYFFADDVNGWIRVLHPADGTARGFATGIPDLVDLKVAPEGSLYYLVRGGNGSVGRIRYNPTSVTRSPDFDAARSFQLYQNYPNPFNPSTNIKFQIPSSNYIMLKVYDVLGREVSTISAENLTAGTYERQWNAAGLSSGVYYCRLSAGEFVQTRNLLLVR